MIKIINIRLSTNPETIITDDESGVNGKCNLTLDNKSFVVLDVIEDSNPFKFIRRTVSYFKNDNGNWAGYSPKEMEDIKGKPIEGGLIVTAKVAPYFIGDLEQTKYTTLILPHEVAYYKENRAKFFESLGKPLTITPLNTLINEDEEDHIESIMKS